MTNVRVGGCISKRSFFLVVSFSILSLIFHCFRTRLILFLYIGDKELLNDRKLFCRGGINRD